MKTAARLSKPSTIAMWVSAVAILGVFVFPLWKIGLRAPQYPQGLGIDIWIHRIEGATPHDLQNINGLNHYIGMKAIVPDSIPELRYMKFFVIGLSAMAAAVALTRRRWALVVWVVVAMGLAGAGMYDFYKWEHDYGNELSPDAAIKVPGMSYQPPMLGTKQLLNFTTTAYPGIGGLLAMLGVGLGVASLVLEVRRSSARQHECTACACGDVRTATTMGAIALLAIAGCARGPQAIAYGTDACEFCAMTISDERYGAALVTVKGRTHKFDSIECMVQATMDSETLAGVEVDQWYVTSYPARAVLVPAAGVSFLVSENLPSPMGAGLTAFADRVDAQRMRQEKGGEVLDWPAVQNHVRNGSKS